MPVLIEEDRATFRWPLGEIGKSSELAPVVDSLTHLTVLDNTIFRPRGAIRKRGGGVRFNSSAIQESGSDVTFHTLFDAHKSGTLGVDTQFFMAYAGTRLLSSDTEGTWDERLTGLEDDKVGNFQVFDDTLIWSSDSTLDVPRSWDFAAATFSNLAGSPPNFAFSLPHQNRHWAAGDAANPSRLYYSNLLDPEDWSGGGSIDIDPNDGDRIVGMVEHLDDLWIFKGPNVGSIHRIRDAETIANVSRKSVSRGLAAIAHAAIITVGTDIFFMTREGLASFSTTERFGDIEQALVTEPVRTHFVDEINQNRIKFIQMEWYGRAGLIVITLSDAGQFTNDHIHVYDPIQGRWADPWTINAASMAIRVDTAGNKSLYTGGYDGFVVKQDSPDRADPGGAAIAWKLRTPALTFATDDPRFTPNTEKSFHRVFARIKGKGDFDIDGTLKIDDQAAISFTLPMGQGTNTLGSFTLGTDILGPGAYVEPSAIVEGKGKTAIIELINSTLREDVEIYELGVEVESAGAADDSVS